MSEKKVPIYLMPGLGAGPKLFRYLHLPDKYEIHYLRWIIPSKNENLETYAKRLLKQVKHENPILLGVSFGGIVIQEMAKFIPAKQLVIVSSIKHHNELPLHYKIALRYKLYKLVPPSLLKRVDLIETISPSKRLKQKMRFYQEFLEMDNPEYIKWAIKHVLTWRQTQDLKNFVHIIGEKDRIFPLKYIEEPKIIVPNGRHDMIVFHARWFNRNLLKLLI